MSTEVEICSNAVLMLGDQAIAAFTDDSTRAGLASNLFPNIRDAVLRSHPWNCAVKRVALSPDVTVPAYGYAYQFLKPLDWMRTLAVGKDGDEVEFRDEAGYLLADDNPLYLRYVFKNTVTATWDALLVQGVTLAMAAALAYPLTSSTALAESLQKQAGDLLKQARSVDGQDNPPETLGDFPMYTSRFSGRLG